MENNTEPSYTDSVLEEFRKKFPIRLTVVPWNEVELFLKEKLDDVGIIYYVRGKQARTQEIVEMVKGLRKKSPGVLSVYNQTYNAALDDLLGRIGHE